MDLKQILQNLNIDYNELLSDIGKILIIIIFSVIVYHIVRIVIKRLFSITFNFKNKKDSEFVKKRQRTIEKIILSLWRYFFYIVTFLIILSTFGVNIQTILTGAGILGVIFAVGSQHLLQDFLEGFFNVFEDNISVGDYVTIDGTEGHIIDIGLRTIKIKSFSGEVHIIPNSKIGHLINYSLDNGKAIVDIRVDYDVDLYAAITVIKNALEIIKKSNANILSDPIVMGVNKLDTIGYEIRIICETVRETHWSVQRFMRGELMKTFKEQDINIGINQILIKEPKHM